MDHQGRGLSEGERLYVERFDHYERDYIEFIRDTLALTSESAHVKEAMMHFPQGLALKSLPRFLLGHSMGSLISLQMMHDHTDIEWNGAIMCSGAFQRRPAKVSPTESKLVGCQRSQRTRTLPSRLFQLQDRANHAMGWRVYCCDVSLMPSIHTPLLIFHGENDTVTPPGGSLTLYETASSTIKEMHVIPQMYHELIHDSCHDSMLDHILRSCKRM
ncbi:hypothetical protein AC1031_021639 [Aphanomyces cochlioides]|nr:hypothetical protein AC1031_021639 [Aphanomyces cochlioides]